MASVRVDVVTFLIFLCLKFLFLSGHRLSLSICILIFAGNTSFNNTLSSGVLSHNKVVSSFWKQKNKNTFRENKNVARERNENPYGSIFLYCINSWSWSETCLHHLLLIFFQREREQEDRCWSDEVFSFFSLRSFGFFLEDLPIFIQIHIPLRVQRDT